MQFEINDVALPVRVRNTWHGLAVGGCLEEDCSEFFCIGFPNSNGGKNPRLVTATRVFRVQAVVP
jgi:hypothetical protein